MISTFLLAAGLWLPQLQSPIGFEPPAELAPARLRADLEYLASNDLRGRKTGTDHEKQAAEWIAKRFESLGLEPLGDSYYHDFPINALRLDHENTLLTVDGDYFDIGDDFQPHPGAPEGEVEAPIVFVGYGLYAPEYEYDDFDGIDLEGKVALLFRWELQASDRESPFLGRRFLPQARLHRKIAECARRGAVGVLVANPPGITEEKDAAGAPFWPATSSMYRSLVPLIEATTDEKRLRETNFTLEEAARQFFLGVQAHGPLGSPIPVAYVSEKVVQLIFGNEGRDALEWVREVDTARFGDSFETSSEAIFQVRFQPQEQKGRNVVAVLPGSNPERAGEYVVVGAHFDHVGANDQGEIWNGADDNGSGTVALLGLAAIFAHQTEAPERSLVFIAFSGEEFGLVGAASFLNQGRLPADRVSAMVNMDMIGRPKQNLVHAVGTASAPGLRGIVERAAEGIDLRLDFERDDAFHRSDQFAFYCQEIPVVFFNTGEHNDYHTPADTAEKIDYEGLARIAQVARRTVRTLANMPTALEWEDGYRVLNQVFGRGPDVRLVPARIRFEHRLDY